MRGQLRVAPPGGANFAHVDNVVAGHVAAAEKGRVGERYILGGENLSYVEMARIAHDVTGGAGPMLVLPKWSLPPLAWLVDFYNSIRKSPPVMTGERMRLGGETFYFNTSKAEKELDLPKTSFRQALIDTYTWYREHGFI